MYSETTKVVPYLLVALARLLKILALINTSLTSQPQDKRLNTLMTLRLIYPNLHHIYCQLFNSRQAV